MVGSLHETGCTEMYSIPGRDAEKGNNFNTDAARGIISIGEKLGNQMLRYSGSAIDLLL